MPPTIPAPTEDRKPIICAFSISRLRQLFLEVIPHYAAVADLHIIQKGFDEAVQALHARLANHEVDVVVAAGSNGAYLRQHAPVPVALVNVSGFDMLDALAKARKISQRIAIVTHRTTTPSLERFTQRFGIEIEQRCYTNAEDAWECVRELADAGIEAIVGPGLVTDLAEQAGLAGVFLYSQDSVRRALNSAIEIARAGRIEVARRTRLDTIIRQLAEGVIAVDMEERIQCTNPAVERLIGMPAEAMMGRRLSELAPELSLRTTLDTGTAQHEDIVTFRQRNLVVNRAPLQEQGVRTGAVLTFQDTAAIQRVDRTLRSSRKPRQLFAKYHLADIVGDSPAISRARALAAKYAQTDATVLIIGESGTGKELFAQGIHNASRRRRHPFVAFNCAAFPESLLESELFGYEEGAFTGSRRGGKAGLFEAAHTGTVFLDEIGEMPIALQSRLLRVLQEKEVLRLGATDPTTVDVRVIAATHRNLEERVARGEFRQDLYYRLNILRIELPPLRARKEDLASLASHLLEKALRRHGSVRAPHELLNRLLPLLAQYPWPGNVRELENVLERVVVYGPDLKADGSLDLAQLRSIVPELFQSDAAADPASDRPGDLDRVRKAGELAYIAQVLRECNGDRNEACRRLGIGRTTLWRKLRELEQAAQGEAAATVYGTLATAREAGSKETSRMKSHRR